MLQRKYTCNLGETVKELEQFPCMEGQLLVMYVSRLYASMQTQLDIFLGKKNKSKVDFGKSGALGALPNRV